MRKTTLPLHITNQKYKLGKLEYSNLHTCAKLLAQQFMTENIVWMTICPTDEEMYRFMYDKTKEMLDWQE